MTAAPEAPNALDPRVLKDLRDVVGADHVLVDPDLTASYGTDWTGRFAGTPSAVIRPGTVAEVAEVVALCRDGVDRPRAPGRQHRAGRRRGAAWPGRRS